MLGFTILASQGLSSNCSLFRELLCWGGGGSVAFEVFYMYLVYTPDGIILANGILYYLSEVVVLESTSTGLYLERRLLDMRTGAPDWPAVTYIQDSGCSLTSGSQSTVTLSLVFLNHIWSLFAPIHMKS